jgi:hypothetical protein
LSVNRYITVAQQVKSLDESIRIFENSINTLKSVLDQMGGSLKIVDTEPLVRIKNQYELEFKMYSLNQTGNNNVPIISLYKNRPQGKEWTRDDILSDDIVVCTVGSQVGQVLMGSEVLERNLQWSKVWIIRIQSREIDRRYVAAWARYGGLDLQIRPLVSGTTVPMLTKRDLDRVEIPIPSMETQEVIALWGEMVTSMANVFMNFGDAQNEFLTSIRNIGTSFFNDLKSSGGNQ